MKWILSLMLTSWLLSGLGYSQQLSPDEHRLILKALIERDEALAKLRELYEQINASDRQAELLDQRIRLERDIRLSEKKLYLDALQALREYRTKRRPLIVKVITLGIVRDKRDGQLEAEITQVQKEIQEWR